MKIPVKVKKMRNNVVSIGTRIDGLEEKRQDKIEELQEYCQHEFVSEHAKGGLWTGRRICEICCLEEKHGETGYQILINDRVRQIDFDQLCDLRDMRTNI